MTWGNPWAWLGLALLAVPLFIHMLGRRQAKTLPFPTLRFLEASRLQPVRRTRVQDAALLMLRLLVLIAAVAALAQPLFRTEAREAAAASALARAVVVDTSTSMRRTVDTSLDASADAGQTATDAARRAAVRLAAEAAASLIVETADPASELAGASAWLAAQTGTGEVVIVSDFQSGMLDSLALAAVAAPFGIGIERIPIAVSSSPTDIVSRRSDVETVSLVTHSGGSTDVVWLFRAADAPEPEGLALLTADSDRPSADGAAGAALRTLADLRFDAARPVAVVYPGYANRDALLREARAPDSPWMAETIARLRVDELLAAASGDDARVAEPADALADPSFALAPAGPFIRVGETAVAALAPIDGTDRLAFFTSVAPESLASAALIGAIGSTLDDRLDVAELETSVETDPVLESWRRDPADAATAVNADAATDARWFWLLVLALLGAEAFHRRRIDAARASVAQEPAASRRDGARNAR